MDSAIFWAFPASRDPIKVWVPAFAKRLAKALPSLPVPPIIAICGQGLGFDKFASSNTYIPSYNALIIISRKQILIIDLYLFDELAFFCQTNHYFSDYI